MVKKEQMYVMCRLERKTTNGTNIMVSYIPEQFAVQGKYLELKNPEGLFR